ncbi:ABC transporter ATP-binding protein [Amycolatopsis sp. GM8]|uniref:ABC transporter ATP-binding protein n=1 Tax=Amycolatopsis sp. GM8 TaxID=2896530 RepID=UPI001F25996B|nr:ABC transporter ATP-binding protein [Amycolatopsis sp. GM8]
MLAASELVYSYGPVRALRGFSLHVAAGEIVGLVGHNGAGKSTFAGIVSGLLRPESGEVLIAGREPGQARDVLGVAPQHLALYPTVTVAETLSLFGGLAGLRRRALREAIDEVVADLRLSDFLTRRTGTLSGGQQRRAQAAAAMLHRPSLLLLDEPTAGVDPETREALLAAVRARAAQGAAVVYTTHYLPELTELGATVAVAREGTVIARGSANELLRDLPGEVCVVLDDEEIRVSTHDPATTLASLLSGVDRPVRAVELRQPSLDDLYREVAHVG